MDKQKLEGRVQDLLTRLNRKDMQIAGLEIRLLQQQQRTSSFEYDPECIFEKYGVLFRGGSMKRAISSPVLNKKSVGDGESMGIDQRRRRSVNPIESVINEEDVGQDLTVDICRNEPTFSVNELIGALKTLQMTTVQPGSTSSNGSEFGDTILAGIPGSVAPASIVVGDSASAEVGLVPRNPKGVSTFFNDELTLNQVLGALAKVSITGGGGGGDYKSKDDGAPAPEQDSSNSRSSSKRSRLLG